MKTRMIKRVITLLVVLCMSLAALTAGAFADQSPTMSAEPVDYIDGTVQPGEKVPDFTVTLIDGSVFTLSEALKTHKCVMINLWATWCCGCVEEMPVMEEAYKGYENNVAAVCLSPYDTEDEVRDFVRTSGMTMPVGCDTTGLITAMTEGFLPTTIIIDRFGNYAYYEDGSINSVEKWHSIFDTYIADDYTETQVTVNAF